MKKLLALATILTAAVFLLTACKSDGAAVMTYGDSAVTDMEFSYWISTYKYMFMQTYENFEDSRDYYSKTLSGGETYEDKLFDIVLQNVKASLICKEEFDAGGYKLTNDAESKVNEYVDGLIKKAGGKSALNAKLALYGVNCDILRSIYLNDAKGKELRSKLFEDGGVLSVTDEAREEYLSGNYVHFMHLYINNKYEYETDDSGSYVYDSDGQAKKNELTGKALEEKNEKIRAVDEALENGEDFNSVYERYSEDRYYDDGYYLRADMEFFEEVMEKALSLKVGESAKVESDAGTHYILKLELEDEAYNDEKNSDFFEGYDDTVESYLFEKYISEKIKDVEVNEEVIASFSIENAEINMEY